MSNKWNSSVMFPTDSNYIARIIEAAFAPSKSSGNPMITLTWEVVSPSEVEIAGVPYNIAGVKLTTWQVTRNLVNGKVDAEKTAESEKRTKELFTNIGVDPSTINFDNIDVSVLKNKQAYVMITCDTVERRKTPTMAQIEAAKKKGVRPEGDVMKHPITGKALVQYQPKIGEIFGVVDGAPVGASSSSGY